MSKDLRGHFDPLATIRYQREGAEWLLEDLEKTLKKFIENRMMWNAASMDWHSHLFVHFCGLSDPIYWQAHQAITALATESIRLQQWKRRTDGVQQRHASDHDEPRAWFYANFVVDESRWLTGEPRPNGWVDQIFELETDVPLLTGLLATEDLLPLSAWEQMLAMQDTTDPGGYERQMTAGRRISLELSQDPDQLHDPKSPVRKKARAHMLRNMSRSWLANGSTGTALNWLRTFEWREGTSGLSPREVVLRAYAYMPDVEPPPWIAEEVERLRAIPI